MDANSPKQAIPATAGYFTHKDLVNNTPVLHKSISNLTPDYFEFGLPVTLSDRHQSPQTIKTISFSDDLNSLRTSDKVTNDIIFNENSKLTGSVNVYDLKAE